MNPILLQLLACPRCRGALDGSARALRCPRCDVDFEVVQDIPRLNDGATQRDPKIAAEWEVQRRCKELYVDEESIVNHLETLVLPRIIGWLGELEGPVLDLGCGVGFLGRAWANQTKLRNPLVGLDLQVALLDEANAGYVGRVEGDVHRLPFKDEAFGAVVVANALHHMSDPVRALSEVRRVVKLGGKIVSCDPREFSLLERVKRVIRRNDDHFSEYHRAFGLPEYRRIFEAAGLDLERLGFADPLGPLVATGLDILKVGRFGVARAAASLLERTDSMIDRVDPTNRAGFTVVAQARRA
ncbi:MAG TPA: methyltransferase domain-containing protein [Polyangiaceae bacterium]|nr:methyltransferase domain-containing protein [Polyangiaceae bacterium]